MSRRSASDFGSLGERVGLGAAAPDAQQQQPPRPVWVRGGAGWLPGILLRWVRQEDGSWAGEVVMVEHGEPVGYLVPGVLLRPGGEPPAVGE